LPQWGATERPDSAGPADDFTCAICLKNPPPQDTAQPVGCDHIYCSEPWPPPALRLDL